MNYLKKIEMIEDIKRNMDTPNSVLAEKYDRTPMNIYTLKKDILNNKTFFCYSVRDAITEAKQSECSIHELCEKYDISLPTLRNELKKEKIIYLEMEKKHSDEEVLSYISSHPKLTLNEIAAHFRVSKMTISNIKRKYSVKSKDI